MSDTTAAGGAVDRSVLLLNAFTVLMAVRATILKVIDRPMRSALATSVLEHLGGWSMANSVTSVMRSMGTQCQFAPSRPNTRSEFAEGHVFQVDTKQSVFDIFDVAPIPTVPAIIGEISMHHYLF
jgi:hypothetical protein